MAGEYKNLNILNQELIVDVMGRYLAENYEDGNVEKIEKINNGQSRYYFNIEGEKLFLDFYFNVNGKTTIQPFNGTNQAIKIEIAEFIKKELTNILSQENSITVKNIERKDFDIFIELIDGLESVDNVEIHANCCKVKGVQQDSVTITYYNNGTVLMQGSPLRVFNEVMTIISELFIESNEILRVFNSTYKKNIDKDEVNRHFNLIMANSQNRLPDKLKSVIKQAIYNTYFEDDMFDHTFIVFPALRALEGHIKYIALDKNLTIGPMVGSLFNYDEPTDKHKLKEDNLVSNDVKNHLEKQYICYKEQRNVYLHWDELITSKDTTRLLSKQDARQKTFEILKEIDYYYTIA